MTQGKQRRTPKLDRWTLAVMLVTLALFTAALFVKGFTHDLLLEAGVFLVSVKLIIMIYRSQVATEGLERRLDELKTLLKDGKVRPQEPGTGGNEGTPQNQD